MAVDAVQKNKKSYTGSLAVGALTGYALKWAIPVTKQEKDDFYNGELLRIRREATQARKSEIEAIRIEALKNPAADEFIKLVDSKKLLSKEIASCKSPNSDAILRLYSRVMEVAENVSSEGKRFLNLNIKDVRPTAGFIGLGAGLCLVYAIISNALNFNYSKQD